MNMVADGYCTIINQILIFLQIISSFDLKTESDSRDWKHYYIKQESDHFLLKSESFGIVNIRIFRIENKTPVFMNLQIMAIRNLRIRITNRFGIEIVLCHNSYPFFILKFLLAA